MFQYFIIPTFIFFLLAFQSNVQAICLDASNASAKAQAKRAYQLEQDVEYYYSLI